MNIDNVEYPGVDVVLDISKDLPFRDVKFVFAEHFIEHLAFDLAVALLRRCHDALTEDGVLRISTPNLDWVWLTQYQVPAPPEKSVRGCFDMNRAFHAWGHQFLYNEETLRSLLLDAGFSNIVACAYGESTHHELRGIERHERSPAYGTISDLVILEASGRGGAAPEYLSVPRADFLRDIACR